MDITVKRKKILSITLIAAMLWSLIGIHPYQANAADAASTTATLVGNLQTALQAGSDWNPAAEQTKMNNLGNGYYSFTGHLPKGDYQYKVAINGEWNESYGQGSYTNPAGAYEGGNIKLSLAADSDVTFYYNHNTHKIADSTYYIPIAAAQLPRVVGDLQVAIGDAGNWSPEAAQAILEDSNYDNIYSITKDVPEGSYAYKVVLGNAWGTEYPANDLSLVLSQKVPVTFSYNAATHAVLAEYTEPEEPVGTDDPGVEVDAIPANHLRIHYNRADGKYENQGLWLWDDVATPSTNWSMGATAFPEGKVDSYGVYADIPLAANAKKVGFAVVERGTDNKDGGDKTLTLSSAAVNEVWIQQGSDKVFPYEPVELPERTVRVHYVRADNKQSAYGLWTWDDVAVPSDPNNWPAAAAAFTGKDRYGGYVDVALKQGAGKMSFLIVNRTTQVKDGDNRSFSLVDRYNQLWIREGDNKVYISPYWEIPTDLISAEIVNEGKLRLEFTMTEGLTATDLKSGLMIANKNGEAVKVNTVVLNKDKRTAAVDVDALLEDAPLSVTYAGRTVTAAAGWRLLDELYNYEGDDLGATYHSGSVTLKLWAPKASSVTANVYDKNDSTELLGSVELVRGDKGVWTTTIAPADLDNAAITDLKGYYYQYEVTNDGVTKKVLDPYAKSMAEFRVNTKGEAGPDGDTVGKAAIVDLSDTDPVADYDFADIAGYEKREDAIIYEVHTRDFTSDPSIADDLNARFGTFAAFKDKLAYIKSLGVTHIQLLPIMAWYYGDEANMDERELTYSTQDNEYNWGYDPHSYFSPDGAYSENAKDPELRIKEFKDLVNAIHEAGMGVVLDVVYTHMAKASFLDDIVPNYYAFQDANGNNIGDFGNNLATSHKMSEKLMVDSVAYWFNEYKIDGMRFDMMGDATYDSIQHAYDTAAAINPNALFIGEGWITFGGDASDPTLAGKGADQLWMDKTDSVGVFSDEIRNELKSGYGSEGEPRLITGGKRSITTILNNIKAQPSNTPADDPGDIVPYIEAHDNLTLYDVIAQSIKKDPAVPANDLEIHKRVRLGNLIVLTSQGTAFLHAGQEYGKTKQWLGDGLPEQKYHDLKDENGVSFGYFIHDSYDSTDIINKFDWSKAEDADSYPVNHVTKEYTAGLIELRKSTDAFRLSDKDLVDSNVTLIPSADIAAEDLVIGYKNKATDGTGNYYVFINADNTARTLSLSEDLTAGTVLVDNDEAGIAAVSEQSGFVLTENSIELEPLTAVVIKLDAAAPTLAGVELDSDSYVLKTGDSHQTIVYAKYSDGNRKKVTSEATFASSHTAVATVTASGVVKGSGDGEATITASYEGFSASAVVSVLLKSYVQINYIRADKDYTDWNLWVWNTGVQNNQIDFDKVQNGIATVMLEVSPYATGVGLLVRKGNWLQQDIKDDRIIPIKPGTAFTKVNITSGVKALDILPTLTGPILNDGNITFEYRDASLFQQGLSANLTSAKVKVNGTAYEMTYDATKELYTYTLSAVEVGTYEYSFLVAKKGEAEAQVTDPANTAGGKSFVTYRKPVVTITTSVNPGAVSYNESTILTIVPTASEETAYREGYLDLTAVGGPAKVAFDPKLLAQSIAIKDTVTAGTKNIPITLIDQYGNKHQHTGKVTVKARTSAGSLDFDWDEARIYFALTDRFADGDSTNNENVDKAQIDAYHGGDFSGMIDKLDYLQELGINTLWITPIVDNIDFNMRTDSNPQYGYHGYWAKDFTQLDEHLGDMETFKELIDKAHDKGIKIMVDVVLNHTGYGLKEEDNRPTITAEDKARFEGMLRTNGVQADLNPIEGELDGLPDLRTEDPAVRESIIAWQTGWLENAKTERGDTIDFFRVDTVKHVEDTTWKAFKNALTSIDPSFKLMGEYYGASIDSDGGTLSSGQMDSLLDFSFNDEARDFANGSIDAVDAYLTNRESQMDNTRTMAQFLSSHDENGFLSNFVEGDKGKLQVAAALQITAKGQPVIYYGEELGRSGSNDGSMNRTDMPWDKLAEEQALHDHYEKLLNIRAKFSKVYSKGTRTKLAGSDALGYLAFNKAYAGTNVVTVINTSVTSQSITLKVPFVAGTQATDEYSGTTYKVSAGGEVTINVPGRNEGGTVILSGTSTVPSTPGTSTGTTGDTDVQLIDEGSLKNGKDGIVSIQIAEGKKAVSLPLAAIAALAGNDLELKASGVTLKLPNKWLSSLQSLVSASELDGAQLVLDIKQLNAAEAAALVGGIKLDQTGVKLGSGLYDFSLNIKLKNGKIIPVTKFDEPIALSFKVSGAVNQDLIGIYYLGNDGQIAFLGGSLKDGAITTNVFHFSIYAVLEYDKSFTDVPASHWAYAAIRALASKHIVTGINDKQFAPEANVTRAEFAALLVRALGAQPEGTSSFADVGADKWYSAYVATASKLGIVKGRSDKAFAPNDTISREEMAVMIVRAYELKKGQAVAGSTVVTAFSDSNKISSWAVASVAAASELGLVQGRANQLFAPQGTMTRAESAQVIFNLLK